MQKYVPGLCSHGLVTCWQFPQPRRNIAQNSAHTLTVWSRNRVDFAVIVDVSIRGHGAREIKAGLPVNDEYLWAQFIAIICRLLALHEDV